MRPQVSRVLADRFWQAGISEGSKDDFYARVLDKKNTLEGLASTIRGSVRFVRETCYAIIYCMSRLDLQFYGFLELPGPLANALFADSFSLSAHQVINLLNLVRYLVDHCPVELREAFLPPIIATCFQQMDAKISHEWKTLGVRETVQAAGDELTEEMKAESILRQLTYSAVIMVADFLDPARVGESTLEPNMYKPPDYLLTLDKAAPSTKSGKDQDGNSDTKYPSLRKFCLMHSDIVSKLLVFGSHAIQMHDGRSCGVMLRVFRSIVPEFLTGPTKPPKEADAGFPIPEETAREIREFISSEVLRAAITSLHDTYFVESQKEIGALIATVLVSYCPLTPTPRSILSSLPGVNVEEVDWAINFISRPGQHSRQQRAVVLDLLKDLKGVSISEQGKLAKSVVPAKAPAKKTGRSKMAQDFMTPNEGGNGGGSSNRRQSPNLEGVAGMFDEGN